MFAGIPSDNIHQHILSYLPPIEYTWVPTISTHFNHIMKRNLNLYNQKQYEMRIHPPNMQQNGTQGWKMILEHRFRRIAMKPHDGVTQDPILQAIPSPYSRGNLSLSFSVHLVFWWNMT
eukprot:1043917_1